MRISVWRTTPEIGRFEPCWPKLADGSDVSAAAAIRTAAAQRCQLRRIGGPPGWSDPGCGDGEGTVDGDQQPEPRPVLRHIRELRTHLVDAHQRVDARRARRA